MNLSVSDTGSWHGAGLVLTLRPAILKPPDLATPVPSLVGYRLTRRSRPDTTIDAKPDKMIVADHWKPFAALWRAAT